MRRLEEFIRKDLSEKIILLSGPRQVGKTTLSKSLEKKTEYLNFDSDTDRTLIFKKQWNRDVDLVIFDELHKMKKWKSWIKGVFDTQGIPPSLLVTGSARLDIRRKGGDSLAGRHFLYRLHPFTVRELKGKDTPRNILDGLLRTGGFPQPFTKGSVDYSARWRRSHLDVILREDLIDLEKVTDIKSIEILISLLKNRVGSTVSYSSLARDLQVSVHTVRHWLQILENLFVIFRVTPYHKNIARSFLKESKYYFYDTGAVADNPGPRLENVVACALHAELHFLEDTLGKNTGLHFLRDKQKHEVDFLAVVDDAPIALIEVKTGENEFSPHLFYFQRYFQKIPSYQIVYNIKRPKQSENIKMLGADSFLVEMPIHSKKIGL